MQFRPPPQPQVREGRPAQRPLRSDRGCPLDTAGDRCLWHVGGTAGTYVSVQPWHLFRYIDERVFTYNERDLTDLDRFLVVLGTVAGRRLTYKALTGKV